MTLNQQPNPQDCYYDEGVSKPWGYCEGCKQDTFNTVPYLSGRVGFLCTACKKSFEEGCRMSNGFDRGYHHRIYR